MINKHKSSQTTAYLNGCWAYGSHCNILDMVLFAACWDLSTFYFDEFCVFIIGIERPYVLAMVVGHCMQVLLHWSYYLLDRLDWLTLFVVNMRQQLLAKAMNFVMAADSAQNYNILFLSSIQTTNQQSWTMWIITSSAWLRIP